MSKSNKHSRGKHLPCTSMQDDGTDSIDKMLGRNKSPHCHNANEDRCMTGLEENDRNKNLRHNSLGNEDTGHINNLLRKDQSPRRYNSNIDHCVTKLAEKRYLIHLFKLTSLAFATKSSLTAKIEKRISAWQS